MILHLRIILDHKKDVFRDIQLDASESLEHLHKLLLLLLTFKKGEMASFFLSNKNWDQEDEIPLLSMQEGSSEMKDISIKDVLKNTESKLVLRSRFLTLWRFMIEVEDILGQDSRSDLPNTVLSFGHMLKKLQMCSLFQKKKQKTMMIPREISLMNSMNLNNLMNSNLINKTLYVVLGPTAIGKTALAIELAKKRQTEIISCDSRQFYKEMNIGTAVPSSKELNSITHHFIQHKSIHDIYNVGAFEQEALKKLKELFLEHQVVVMVGGSGLYIDAVCKGLSAFPEIDTSLRKELRENFKTRGMEWLQNEVKRRSELLSNC